MYNNTLGHGICTSCQHNTEGQHCEKCLAKYYRNMDVSMDDLSACIGKIAGLLIKISRQKVLNISKFLKSNVYFIPSLCYLIKYRCKLFFFRGSTSLEVLIIGRDFVLALKDVCTLFW